MVQISLTDVDQEFLEKAARFFNNLLVSMTAEADLTSSDLLQKFKVFSQRSVGKVLSPKQAYEESVIKSICQQLHKEFKESAAKQSEMLEDEAKADNFPTWPQVKEKLDSLFEAIIKKYDLHPKVKRCEDQDIVDDYRNFMKEEYETIVANRERELKARQDEEKIEKLKKILESTDRKVEELLKAVDRANGDKRKVTNQTSATQKTFTTIASQCLKHEEKRDEVKHQPEKSETSVNQAKQANCHLHMLADERVTTEEPQMHTKNTQEENAQKLTTEPSKPPVTDAIKPARDNQQLAKKTQKRAKITKKREKAATELKKEAPKPVKEFPKPLGAKKPLKTDNKKKKNSKDKSSKTFSCFKP
ncbi:DNA ligase 1-like [Watersipora subatra]|uniref:DNA ligase 1-like n=1 Tax=Watersipora subatra TaxID=2589382 RepID=UPI00355B0AAB